MKRQIVLMLALPLGLSVLANTASAAARLIYWKKEKRRRTSWASCFNAWFLEAKPCSQNRLIAIVLTMAKFSGAWLHRAEPRPRWKRYLWPMQSILNVPMVANLLTKSDCIGGKWNDVEHRFVSGFGAANSGTFQSNQALDSLPSYSKPRVKWENPWRKSGEYFHYKIPNLTRFV